MGPMVLKAVPLKVTERATPLEQSSCPIAASWKGFHGGSFYINEEK
jgi:hypothetical protein